jgi:hypothetical protein
LARAQKFFAIKLTGVLLSISLTGLQTSRPLGAQLKSENANICRSVDARGLFLARA